MLKLVLALLLASCSNERAPNKAPAPAKPKASPFETFVETTPKPGELAPAFELADTEGKAVRLRDAAAAGPVVIVFGSFT